MVSTDTVVVVGEDCYQQQGWKFQVPAWHSLRPPHRGCLNTSLQPNEGGSLDSDSLTPIMSRVGGVFLWCLAGVEQVLPI